MIMNTSPHMALNLINKKALQTNLHYKYREQHLIIKKKCVVKKEKYI